MSNRQTNDYQLLWDHNDHAFNHISFEAQTLASTWPGYPLNPVQPHPIIKDNRYIQTIRPVPPLGGRNTKRGGGYSSLSNYNVIP